MKKALKHDCFRTLNRSELIEIKGGFPWALLLVPILSAAGAAAVDEIIHDWDNFKAGLFGMPEIKS